VTRHHLNIFTAFDIWLAGLSRQTFKQIQANSRGGFSPTEQTLLENSLLPHDAYKLKDDPDIGNKVRVLRRTGRARMAPLSLPRE